MSYEESECDEPERDDDEKKTRPSSAAAAAAAEEDESADWYCGCVEMQYAGGCCFESEAATAAAVGTTWSGISELRCAASAGIDGST